MSSTLRLSRANHSSASATSASRRIPLHPLWAQLVAWYEHSVPNHRGKRFLLRALITLNRRRRFAWRMKNGVLLVFSPEEGLVSPETVGWTCFLSGCWEPHVKKCIDELLTPGDVAIDVGANLGYFSAVMAQRVGATGQVWSFEPVPETYERLLIARDLNGFDNLTPLPFALAASEGPMSIAYDARLTGNASLLSEVSVSDRVRRVEVRAHTLDGLIASGVVTGLPALVKIDVEGFEFEVLKGAERTIEAARPAIIFEFNERTARLGGWSLTDIEMLLSRCGRYELFRVNSVGLTPVEAGDLALARDEYVDVLALEEGHLL